MHERRKTDLSTLSRTDNHFANRIAQTKRRRYAWVYADPEFDSEQSIEYPNFFGNESTTPELEG